MVNRRWHPVVTGARALLERVAVSSPPARRLFERAGRELSGAAERAYRRIDQYGPQYYGQGRDPSGDRGGLSGYATYDRMTSNADIAAYVIWRTFGGAKRTLDVGCATGFVVEALRELGLDAQGCDVSRYAVDHATAGARGHVRVADPRASLPWPDGEFEVVSALEILEHLAPADVPAALAELRRVCSGYLYATIPSFGGNNGAGPGGHYEGKVRPERLDHYKAMGLDYDGPVPTEDLARDAVGELLEGHETIASFGWWTARFGEAGFERRPAIERRIYDDIEAGALTSAWNVYVLGVPGSEEDVAVPRSPDLSLVELGLRHPRFGT